jgi:hypothetical protein
MMRVVRRIGRLGRGCVTRRWRRGLGPVLAFSGVCLPSADAQDEIVGRSPITDGLIIESPIVGERGLVT